MARPFLAPCVKCTIWAVQDLDAGPVQSVSFSVVPASKPGSAAAGDADRFSAPDFVVGSSTGSIVAVRSASFEENRGDGSGHRLLVQVPPPLLCLWSSCSSEVCQHLSISLAKTAEEQAW